TTRCDNICAEIGRLGALRVAVRRRDPPRAPTDVWTVMCADTRVHLYAQCWNDATMLPFFFRHYDSFVDKYIIFDDASEDGSLAMLLAHPNVEVRRFPWSDPESFVLSE